MAYVVDRVVICNAFREPDKHYQLLAGGKSKLVQGRRSSVRFLASAKDVKGGIAGVVGKEASLFEDMLASSEQQNDFVNQLRDEVRGWREASYPGTALVTRRLLEWWFERDEERRAIGRRFFYDAFDMVPPEYHDEFHPNVVVCNWQGIPLEGRRDDWIPEDVAGARPSSSSSATPSTPRPASATPSSTTAARRPSPATRGATRRSRWSRSTPTSNRSSSLARTRASSR